MNITSSSAIA